MTNNPHIVDSDAVESTEQEHDGTHELSQQRIGQAAGSERLGCSLYTIPPGKTGWPYHYHTANEEAMYVLEGQGTLRIGGEEHPIEAGDYIAFPTGPNGAHQLSNPSDTNLRFLAVSTMIQPDIVVHPDSDKFALLADEPLEATEKGDEVDGGSIRYLRADARMDLWEDEP